ncbi:hypothetical protein QN382_06125 [Pseudomonas sp. 10B1]|uniref:hypothetical protein n=1 Tax=unclassified Pseudomonas TaxID=196821 RepID=UPI002AB4720F|nr:MULTISPECIES: hypothetical protein [unclassified Pseudomonas]MDY7563019.1 hypothetical protein [Pseudomonas sp. AB6]MEA9976179.1 hypothetical protein [Pseudomonas sp. RTS4]MEA9995393.1 hypothetical protein [Pseudomonas sp. AA4]MEB0085237.1 hypothetical protein [Pseudomonas sp. RTI1]MEB0125340.1 hypothetical protein [Pseudomonas sp. CCC1.2]
MINNIQAPMLNSTVVDSITTARLNPQKAADPTAIDGVAYNLPTISTLSRQLSDSATRAELRDERLSRKQLTELGNTLTNTFSGEGYFSHKAQHDREAPDSNDPELIARAQQATEYVNSAAVGGKTVKNPFDGLSRDQLALITFDDSGLYTVNERRAASYCADHIEEAWCKKVADMAMEEYNRTGTAQTPKVLAEMLSHYRTLPRIEQAQFPEGYATDLQSKIGPGSIATNK